MIPSRDILAKHLAGMVRYATVSDADESKMDFSVFEAFHKYLEETYPLVHRTFTREVVGKAALLYHWACPAPTKPPVLLAAHQDWCIRMPMREGARSLNLSNSVAVGVYEVLRQWDFPELLDHGHLRDYEWK